MSPLVCVCPCVQSAGQWLREWLWDRVGLCGQLCVCVCVCYGCVHVPTGQVLCVCSHCVSVSVCPYVCTSATQTVCVPAAL